MLQSARVSKEPYQETMRHNNSFPWEASGVEPIVCTLLRLWMLPLLQRAYINLAGSKPYCGASVPSPHSKWLPVPAAAIKGPVVPVLGSPKLNLARPEVVGTLADLSTGPCLRPASLSRTLTTTHSQTSLSLLLVVLKFEISTVVVPQAQMPPAQELRWSGDVRTGDFRFRICVCAHVRTQTPAHNHAHAHITTHLRE